MFRSWFCLIALSFALSHPQSAEARAVRVATYNVQNGVGIAGSSEYNAVRSILQRVNADIIAFQELRTSDRLNWEALATELGYNHSTYSAWTGLSGNLYTGYYSRWPLLDSHSVLSPSGANEISRPPFHIKIDVPGARYPLGLWTLHHKAISGSSNQFRRAIEAHRTAQDIDAYLATNSNCTEFVVLGDFNDDVDQSQSDQFFSLPSGLPSSYSLGTDIAFPVPYRVFPRDAYEVAGTGMQMLETFQEDSIIDNTFINSSGRLDYIFVSDTIAANAHGMPVAEIYNSTRDDGFGGLSKTGSPLPSPTSSAASDHYLVFVDLQMVDVPSPADAVPGDWRLQYFGHADPQAGDLSRAEDDADLDGYSNFKEYIAGTHPLVTEEVPQVANITPAPSSVDLTIATLTGRVYTIEHNDALPNPAAWEDLTSFSGILGTGSTLVHTDAAVPGFRAYRLRIELVP